MKKFLIALIIVLLADISFQIANISYKMVGKEYSIFSIDDWSEVEE